MANICGHLMITPTAHVLKEYPIPDLAQNPLLFWEAFH